MARFSLSTIKLYLLMICIPVGNCSLVQCTLKGNFELQPPSPNYDFIWDVVIVLEFSNTIDVDIPLNVLTRKLIT